MQDATTHRVFHKADKDGDHKLSFAEYAALEKEKEATPAWMAKETCAKCLSECSHMLLSMCDHGRAGDNCRSRGAHCSCIFCKDECGKSEDECKDAEEELAAMD